MAPSSLGLRIVYYRKKIGVSQTDLAAAAGISHSTVSGYEKDKRKPDIPTLLKIAKILNVTADTLLGLESPENSGESNMLRAYRNLNCHGRDRAVEFINWLEETLKYTDNSLH